MKAYDHRNKEEYVLLETLSAALAATDCCYLLALAEIGWRGKRMRKLMQRGREIYMENRDRYCVKDDLKKMRKNAPHILAMIEELKGYGLDYDLEMSRVESEDTKFRGNKVLLGNK